MLLDTLEEWLSLIIGMILVGSVFLVIAFIFRSPVVWLCLGLLTGLLFFFPIARTFLTIIAMRKSRRRQDYEEEHQRSWKSETNQKQQVRRTRKQKRLSLEVKQPSPNDAGVRTYVPPGLPPDLFL